MEIRTYGLDSYLSKHNSSVISNWKSNSKFAFTFKNINYDRNFSSVDGVCSTAFFEENFRKLAK